MPMRAWDCRPGVSVSTCFQLELFQHLWEVTFFWWWLPFSTPLRTIPGLVLFKNTMASLYGFTVAVPQWVRIYLLAPGRPLRLLGCILVPPQFRGDRWLLVMGRSRHTGHQRAQLGVKCWLGNLTTLRQIYSYDGENQNSSFRTLSYNKGSGLTAWNESVLVYSGCCNKYHILSGL